MAVQCKLAVVEVKDQDKPLRMPSKFGIFKTTKTWNTIIMRSAEAKWAKLVWFLAISRHASMLWLAVLNWLSTKENLCNGI